MKRLSILATAAVSALAVCSFVAPAIAADGGAPAPRPAAVPSANPAPAAAGEASANHPGPLAPGAETAPLPAGHPMVAPDDESGDDGEDGAGMGGMGGAPGAPPPNGNGGGTTDANGIFRAPPDPEMEDPSLPPGTIAVRILDANGMPVPHAPITLGILKNSVAKGESREKVIREADANGVFVFGGLTVGSGIAYRVSSPRGDGTYAAMPFNLPSARGMRVTLHVYDASGSIQDARIVFQTALYVEVKDDRVQFEQLFAVFNFGKVAWIPGDAVIPLPPEYTAFSAQQEMSDTGADAVAGKGIKLHGTFGPGRHDVTFRWQLPYDGASELALDVGLPLHVATARVVAAAAPGMTLSVDGFPGAQSPPPEAGGQRVLQTERQVQPNDPPLRTLHVRIKDLPTAGPARFVATGIAGVGVLAGLAFAFGRAVPSAAKKPRRRERALLLAELEDLEHAHAEGEIGPKTYERARRELVDALARTLGDAAIS